MCVDIRVQSFDWNRWWADEKLTAFILMHCTNYLNAGVQLLLFLCTVRTQASTFEHRLDTKAANFVSSQ